MALTRARTAARKTRQSPALKDEGTYFTRRPMPSSLKGKQPKGISPRYRSRRKAPRLQEQSASGRTGRDCSHPSPVEEALSPQGEQRGTKRLIEASHRDPAPPRKRPRISPASSAENTVTRPATGAGAGAARSENDPIAFWARERSWPREFYQPHPMEHLLARKRSLPNLGRKRSNSATSTTPSDQKPREEKGAAYRDSRYEILLVAKGSYMTRSPLGITDESKRLYQALLDSEQPVPKESLFDDDIFESACENIESKNEARVIQDISRLIVPSAEQLALHAKHLQDLIESVNEGWNNSIPLTNPRPQPDYSVGFKREAFAEDRLAKLSPFVGDIIANQSLFLGTYYMYFPFLACEVKCGDGALNVADRQNAHSMTLAVRAVVELFRGVKREHEIHRQILAFSISHDHRSVRIYGHYPVIHGKDTQYYRHPIHTFDFTALDGKEKWTAYRFTKNIYDIWMPKHFERICSVIDQIPTNLNFDVPPLSETTGLSQGLESHHLSQSDANSAPMPVEQDSLLSNTGQQETPDTSFTGPGPKKRKGIVKE